MEAGLRLFGEKGLAGTSSNEIARRAGVSIGTFYSYFKDKRSLFLAILKMHLDTFVTGIYLVEQQGDPSIDSIIRDHVQRAFAIFDRQLDFHRQALVMKFTDPEVRRLFEEVEEKQLSLITALLERHTKPSKNRDLKVVAKVIHGAVENAAHAVKFLASPFKEERFTEELTSMIQSYVEGLTERERG
ncbi:MAG TPA: TetR/AcrR family transcriptional regulator [Deltaproteobacteria bacterium]|nr:TetR/AcrR family transcriptional regulator [Deltaproteobacteria bacterium]HOM29212.1 TetR/AcrR family transcriptional regulator [Deltaproteobacteria bacterium]HPP81604.1 TetR/AcrR family transcriptional regulator [Deltaproteobacteria bacterium]